jgi:predicted aminopeptidase
MARILILLFLSVPLAGCYYMQAASGQWEVIRKREPLSEVIDDPETSEELASRLRLLEQARDFSIAELGLPDNKSYRSYAELERDYVVWNVFAAPEFSLAPRQWCFPVAGCVSYRGYFSKEDAIKESERLASDGFDIAVGGVTAYSTLGKFNDPILSTMMRRDDVDLVAVLFHELAHQMLYVKDDSAFNESFATAVEEIGLQLWLESRGEKERMAEYMAGRDLQQSLTGIVATAREGLKKLYASDINIDEKRARKFEHLDQLSQDITVELERNGRPGSAWLSGELNNARLISTVLYEGHLPSFRAIFKKCQDQLDCFYAESKGLAKLKFAERQAALSAGDL